MQTITNLMNYTGLAQQSCHPDGRYSLSPPNIARNLSKIVIPAILLLGANLVQGAEAGPSDYSACITGCTLFATPVAFPGCVIACLPLLFLPTP